MKAYSVDLGERILKACDAGMPTAAVADQQVFGQPCLLAAVLLRQVSDPTERLVPRRKVAWKFFC